MTDSPTVAPDKPAWVCPECSALVAPYYTSLNAHSEWHAALRTVDMHPEAVDIAHARGYREGYREGYRDAKAKP